MDNFKGAMSFGGEFPGRVAQSKMGSLKPDLISDFPGVEMVGSSRGYEFLGRIMGCESFFSGFIKSRQSFLKGREEGLSQSRVRTGFIAIK